MILFGNIEGHSIQYYKQHNKVTPYHILVKNQELTIESDNVEDFAEQMEEIKETTTMYFNAGGDYLHFLLESLMKRYGNKVTTAMTTNQSIYEIKVKFRRRVEGKIKEYSHNYRGIEHI